MKSGRICKVSVTLHHTIYKQVQDSRSFAYHLLIVRFTKYNSNLYIGIIHILRCLVNLKKGKKSLMPQLNYYQWLARQLQLIGLQKAPQDFLNHSLWQKTGSMKNYPDKNTMYN